MVRFNVGQSCGGRIAMLAASERARIDCSRKQDGSIPLQTARWALVVRRVQNQVWPADRLASTERRRAVEPCPSPLQLKNAVNLNRDAHRQRMHAQCASSRQIVLPKQRQQEVTGAIGHLRMLGERLFCTHVDC